MLRKEQQEYIRANMDTMSREQIAKNLGCVISTVYRYISLFGGHTNKSKEERELTEIEETVRYLARNHTVGEIVAKTGISERVVQRIIAQASTDYTYRKKPRERRIAKRMKNRAIWAQEERTRDAERRLRRRAEKKRRRKRRPRKSLLPRKTCQSLRYLCKRRKYIRAARDSTVLFYNDETDRTRWEDAFLKRSGIIFLPYVEKQNKPNNNGKRRTNNA